MLIVVRTVDDGVVERLFGVYAESMGDLSVNFSNERETRSSYRDFLEGFVSDPGHLVLVEEDGGVWKSALRAVSCDGDCWFIEAVETDPSARRRGNGRLLLSQATEYLRSLGAREVTCVIYRGNEASRRLHESCGFKATDEDPVDPWGDRDECGVLYRSRL
ncbi:MAG: GNAT family N-acetyltransferase [Olsenella sp.]|nr:GNAT family N-acetyltransferase [Olsenella sp.]